MPTLLLRWPTKSEADVGDMTVEVEPYLQYSVKFSSRVADDSRGAVWQNGFWHGSACEAKVCNLIPSCGKNYTQWHSSMLAERLRRQTVDVSTVRWWVACFSCGDGDVKDKSLSGWSCPAVTPRNEERLDQLIRANRWITTRKLCTELNISFNALETIVASLEYRKVCARFVPRMLTPEHIEHHMAICQDLLNQYEAEGEIFLDHIITGDETWCHHNKAESKRQSTEWRRVNSS
jgi:hypothetical protein